MPIDYPNDKPPDINPGDIVTIAAFDDVPEHDFEVDEVHEDCVTGVALTGPLTGCYGEPDLAMVLRVTTAKADRQGTSGGLTNHSRSMNRRPTRDSTSFSSSSPWIRISARTAGIGQAGDHSMPEIFGPDWRQPFLGVPPC